MSEGHTLLKALRPFEARPCDPVARYLLPNASTAFGIAHNFDAIQSYHDFAEAIPLQDYQSLEPWIERAIGGEPAVLTVEDPVGFELTSGTSYASKAIPVTPAFQSELATALGVWMREWERSDAEIFDGPAYWSLSPRLGGERRTPTGLPLGFNNDGAYFPPNVAVALSRWLTIPSNLAEDLFEDTARCLLATPGLRAVSVWSPVFFLRLDEALGTSRTWHEIWPQLRVVSCWADAEAALWRDRIIDRIGPGITLEPKGLLSTEGVTSIPTQAGPRLAEGIHFHEFIDYLDGTVSTASELVSGRHYEVVLTTAAGLYRYRTGDLIEIHSDGCVSFVGRRGGNSDLVGEKLDCAQVTAAFRESGSSGFLRAHARELRYEIWSTDPAEPILAALRQNAHFARALDTGQLASCSTHPLPRGWEQASVRLLAAQQGAREGDVKLPVLERGELSDLWES